MTKNAVGFRPLLGELMAGNEAYKAMPDEGWKLKLEDAIARLAEQYFVGDATPTQMKLQNPIDFALDLDTRHKLQLREIIQRDLRMTLDFDEVSKYGADWHDFDLWVLEREKAQETWATWIKWFKSDDFRVKNMMFLTPKKIKQLWPQATYSKEKYTPPVEDRFAGKVFVPAPTEKEIK